MIRRRSSFFTRHAIPQEPLLKCVKCRLLSRTGYYLNITSKGKLSGITKRELESKLERNKRKRDSGAIGGITFEFEPSTSHLSIPNRKPAPAVRINSPYKPGVNQLDEEGNDVEAMFYLIPVGLRVVAIQHVLSEEYIAMDIYGKLYASQTYTVECKFKESCVETAYITYASTCWLHPVKQSGIHIGIDYKGHVARGTKFSKWKDGAHFIPETVKVVWLKEPGTTAEEVEQGMRELNLQAKSQQSIALSEKSTYSTPAGGGVGMGPGVGINRTTLDRRRSSFELPRVTFNGRRRARSGSDDGPVTISGNEKPNFLTVPL